MGADVPRRGTLYLEGHAIQSRGSGGGCNHAGAGQFTCRRPRDAIERERGSLLVEKATRCNRAGAVQFTRGRPRDAIARERYNMIKVWKSNK